MPGSSLPERTGRLGALTGGPRVVGDDRCDSNPREPHSRLLNLSDEQTQADVEGQREANAEREQYVRARPNQQERTEREHAPPSPAVERCPYRNDRDREQSRERLRAGIEGEAERPPPASEASQNITDRPDATALGKD